MSESTPAGGAADQTPGITALAERVRAALADQAHTDLAAQTPAGPFRGTAVDGQVEAEIGADGRLRSLSVADALYREPLVEISAAIRTAVNAAIDARAGGTGFGPVVEFVSQVQAQARRDLGAVAQAMAETAQRIRSAQQGAS